MSRIRGFEVVSDSARKNPDSNIILPTRSTNFSAGYDIITPIDISVPAYGPVFFWTDIKAYMRPDEYLKIVIRSSLGIKKNLFLLNQVGVIDCDYYGNEDNDGNIGIGIGNRDHLSRVVIEKGEKVVQAIFTKYLLADNDNSDKIRAGGIGSTNDYFPGSLESD